MTASPTADTVADPTVADRRVHPATVPLRFIKGAPSTLLGLPAAFAYISRGQWTGMLAFAGLLAGVVMLLHWLTWRRFRYGVGAHDIVIESGLLTRTRRSIPFDRIQDVDIERGPLQRMFGLAKVRIETGGAAADEGVIDSVTLADADALRAAVRAGRDGAPAASTDVSPDDAPPARTVFAMSLPRVLTAGLFNFSLLYLAGLFGLLQTFKGLLPFDIYDPGRWLGLVGTRVDGRVGPGAIGAVLLVALIVGVVFGVVRTLATDYGFRLTADDARFRRTRGLATRSDVVLPKRRVQLALITGGPLRSALGWSVMHFQTLSGAAGAGGRQNVAPLASTSEIAVVLGEQGSLRLPDEPTLQRVSSRHIVRSLIRWLLMPALAILAAGAAFPPALFAAGMLPFTVLLAVAERRRHVYALTPDLLFIRRGIWRQTLWIVPTRKVQTTSLTRSWLQRRLGLATVAVDTAGAAAIGSPAIIDLSLARARALIAKLADARDHSGRKSGTDR